MTTLPPSGVKEFPEDSIEKKVYNLVDSFSEYIPVPNDRNRLGFALYKYVRGEGDEPSVTLRSTKVKLQGISVDDLAKKLNPELEKMKKEAK